MFSIGLQEILVVVLVSIVALDKNKFPVFIDLIRKTYRHFIVIKLKIRNLLKNAGVEDLCKDYYVEKVNYVVGKDGKFYPSYSIDNTSKDNDSKDTDNR
ncbi:hypothetical protein GOY14_01390 [Wolbachia endosymbiont of Dipetalonema caudispina]|uniref:Sec-independent protein translocase subunit TatB n=1 Tax=Wolbachia endosymbiont of Dipetalonema caudispina TaxID=1812112 RepID=UPI00158BD542|nr:hypothetical protein [Wolbachia endosymbiont of Dipetalonema caudispina]QKX00992.1 hypothetical protein GOY14_01390 [Wolbachia endosymbiont of Dipetalonema caudispina]